MSGVVWQRKQKSNANMAIFLCDSDSDGEVLYIRQSVRAWCQIVTESNFAWRDCGDRKEWCTVAGGVTELGIAGITVFLRAALDRPAKATNQVKCTWGSHMMTSRWRNICEGGVC